MPSQFLVAAAQVVAGFVRPFTDAFTRANAATLGSPWIQPASGVAGSGIGIVSNQAAKPVGGSSTAFGVLGFIYALIPYGAGLQDIAVDHILVSTTSSQAWLIFGAAADMSSYYVLAFNGASGGYDTYLSKFVGSTETDYNTNIPTTVYVGAAGAHSRWRVTYDPSSGLTTVYQDGTQKYQVTISAPLQGTYAGIALAPTNDANALALDNFATA